MLDEALKAIREAACPQGVNDFNYDVFQGKDIRGDAIRACAEMLPMMAERRLVVVQDIQEVPLAELEPLRDYFKDPSPTTCLVIHARTSEDKKIDGRSGFIRALTQVAESCEFKPMYENEVGPFVLRQAQRRGMHIDQQALAYLIDAVGTKLADLDHALEKIDLYLGPSADGQPRQVHLDQAAAVVARTRSRSVFDLTDALGDQNFQLAIEVLERMLLDGQAPILIARMISRHFRIVARLQDPQLRNAPNSEKARAVRVSPYFLRDYERHGRTFSPREVAAILRRMLQVDIALKSSHLPDRVIMEQLLTDICLGAPRRTPQKVN